MISNYKELMLWRYCKKFSDWFMTRCTGIFWNLLLHGNSKISLKLHVTALTNAMQGHVWTHTTVLVLLTKIQKLPYSRRLYLIYLITSSSYVCRLMWMQASCWTEGNIDYYYYYYYYLCVRIS
jgi:hypothetical protein